MHLRGEPGQPGSCTCAIYDRRYDNMLIVMVDSEGEARDLSYCEPGSWPECCAPHCSPDKAER